VEIIAQKEDCDLLMKTLGGKFIISSPAFKKILNDYFNPDRFFFTKQGSDIFPLVVKNNCAYFYGGDVPYNDYNLFPRSKSLISKTLDYLQKNNINFKLTSIINDPITSLEAKYRKHDVPYNQNWSLNNINEYNSGSIIEKTKVKKKRDKIKRSLKKMEDYNFIRVEREDYISSYMNNLLDLSISSFSKRGKINSWEMYGDLYRNISEYFLNNHDCINTVITKDHEILGSYNLVFSGNEAFLAFCNCYNLIDKSLAYILYFDALEESKNYAQSNKVHNLFFNAGRGSFSYKKRMKLNPLPMYAIVDHPDWKIKLNTDLSYQETTNLYKRRFFGFNDKGGNSE